MNQKIESLKQQIDEQREWGNNKLADILAEDLEQTYADEAAEARLNRKYDDKWSHDW